MIIKFGAGFQSTSLKNWNLQITASQYCTSKNASLGPKIDRLFFQTPSYAAANTMSWSFFENSISFQRFTGPLQNNHPFDLRSQFGIEQNCHSRFTWWKSPAFWGNSWELGKWMVEKNLQKATKSWVPDISWMELKDTASNLKPPGFFVEVVACETPFFSAYFGVKKHHIKRKPLVVQTWQHHRWSFASVFYDGRKSGSTCWYGDIAFQRTVRFMLVIRCLRRSQIRHLKITWT